MTIASPITKPVNIGATIKKAKANLLFKDDGNYTGEDWTEMSKGSTHFAEIGEQVELLVRVLCCHPTMEVMTISHAGDWVGFMAPDDDNFDKLQVPNTTLMISGEVAFLFNTGAEDAEYCIEISNYPKVDWPYTILKNVEIKKVVDPE